MKNNTGVTLLELIIVISIIGIMTATAGFSFHNWMDNYKVESQIKEMYADLMHARIKAMHRNRVHFVKLEGARYTIYEDTNPVPDGNNDLELTAPADTQVLQKNTNYTIESHLGSGNLKFNKNGLPNIKGDIRLVSDAAPDYDCITIHTIRIRLGKWKNSDCTTK